MRKHSGVIKMFHNLTCAIAIGYVHLQNVLSCMLKVYVRTVYKKQLNLKNTGEGIFPHLISVAYSSLSHLFHAGRKAPWCLQLLLRMLESLSKREEPECLQEAAECIPCTAPGGEKSHAFLREHLPWSLEEDSQDFGFLVIKQTSSETLR